MQVQIDPVDYEIVANRKTVKQDLTKIHKTHPHPQTSELAQCDFRMLKPANNNYVLGKILKTIWKCHNS